MRTQEMAMLEAMTNQNQNDALLLLDTCGERGSVALFRGDDLLAEAVLPERTASAALLEVIRSVLREAGIRLGELSAIGVVRGPGSFTGVRVGLAVAKGLCIATGVPLAAVSRLEVFAGAAPTGQGLAVLNAGRDEVYVREIGPESNPRERLMTIATLLGMIEERTLVCAEPALESRLDGEGHMTLISLSAKDALGAVRQCLAAGGSEVGTADANYVRNEEAIYARR